jgi:hypothetical protein
VKRVASAVGEGAISIHLVHGALAEHAQLWIKTQSYAQKKLPVCHG